MKRRTTTLITALCFAAPATALVLQEGNRPGSAQEDAPTAKPTSPRPSDAAQVLETMSGLWEVQVEVNPSAWRARTGSSDHDQRRADGSDGARGQDQRPNSGQAGRDSDHARADHAGAMQMPTTIQGISEAGTIFDGKVLAMASIMSMGEAKDGGEESGAATRGGDQRSAGSGQGSQAGDEQSQGEWMPPANEDEIMRSLSYFSFDPESKQFAAVFMSDMDGTMHHATGSYDANSRSIIFQDGNGASGKRQGARPVDASAKRGAMGGEGPETAVLRLLGDDTFEVTMYLKDAARKAERGELPERHDGSGKATGDAETTGDAKSAGHGSALPANILYRATYCRATADREEACKEAMKDDRRKQEENGG